jgi:heme-degrading monooxygenase HmoA
VAFIRVRKGRAMAEAKYASGRWQVKDGKVDEFVERWKEWLTWTSESVPGFRTAMLLRSEDDPQRFTSLSAWDDDGSVKAWKTSDDFKTKLAAVTALVDEFVGGDFDLTVGIKAPS